MVSVGQPTFNRRYQPLPFNVDLLPLLSSVSDAYNTVISQLCSDLVSQPLTTLNFTTMYVNANRQFNHNLRKTTQETEAYKRENQRNQDLLTHWFGAFPQAYLIYT